jgi:molecular chaperone GrpE
MNKSQSHSQADAESSDDESRNRVEAATDQAYETFDAVQPSDAPETRDEELDRLRGEVVAADKRVLQAQAEAENFRKRMRRDYEDQLKFAALPLIADILQVRDNLNRAIDAAGASGGADAAEGLREGVAMVVKQFDDTLAKYGVETIPAAGEEFDPNFHEAISQMPNAEIEANKVAFVATEGFRMHGRVIRPAQVVVSTGPA